MKTTAFSTNLAKALILLAGSGLVHGHGAIFGDSVFGSASGGISANPLTNSLSLSQWFFRGLTPLSAKGSITLTPGKSVTMNVACSQDNADNGIMCNDGGGSLHLNNGKGSGCALLISYKNFNSIQPNDMTVFSVLHDCPNMNSKRTFAVPSNLPAGDATCAFHWVPPKEASADEQYMNGFKCTIAGNNGGSLAASNQKPLYWAAQGVTLPNERPQYINLKDGAQSLTVTGGSSASVSVGVGSGSGSSTSSSDTDTGSSSSSSATPTKSCSAAARARRGRRALMRDTEAKRRLRMLKRQLKAEMGAVGISWDELNRL